MNIFTTLRNLNILLIDDDEWIRDSLSMFFENEGCHLNTLEDAEKALEIIECDHFDIMIVDYKLPGMNGLDFLKRIKNAYPDLKMILITAYRNDEITDEAGKIGITQIIDKPFTTSTVEQCLSRLF